MPFTLLTFLGGLIGRPHKAAVTVARANSLATRSAAISSFRQSLPEFSREMDRARRYQRPFAIVVLNFESEQFREQITGRAGGGGNGNATHDAQLLACCTTQLIRAALGSLLRDALRETDLVTYSATDDRYVMLLTESNEAQARRAVERLNKMFWNRTSARLSVGVAQFPMHGLTLEDLIETAQTAWDRPSSGNPPAAPTSAQDSTKINVEQGTRSENQRAQQV